MAFVVSEFVGGIFESCTKVGETEVYRCVFDIKDVTSNYVAFYFEFTKDTLESINIKASFEPKEAEFQDVLKNKFFHELELLDTESKVYDVDHTAAGCFRMIIPSSMTTNRVEILITPSAEETAGTCKVFMSEVCIKNIK